MGSVLPITVKVMYPMSIQARSYLPYRPAPARIHPSDKKVRFRSQQGPQFTYYTAEDVKRQQMELIAQKLFGMLKEWANTGLKTSTAGQRCGFSHAIESGNVAFAICPASGEYRRDYENLSATYGQLLMEKFPVLTKENANRLSKMGLMLALPAYIRNPLPFTAMQHQIRTDFVAEVEMPD